MADVKEEVPWSLLFADDIVLIAASKGESEMKLELWRKALEERGLRISRAKTEYLWMNGEDQGGTTSLEAEEVKRVKSFKYLGSCVTDSGSMETEITHRIQSAWQNWRKTSGVLCDKRFNVKRKGKVYKSVVRPALIYSCETWPMKRAQERRKEVAEMRMLRWMCGVTRRDRIKNDLIRGTVKVTEVSRKLQERRLQWFGHVVRREDDFACKRVMNMEVPGTRRRGRPRMRWRDSVNRDMREKDVAEGLAQDRILWKRQITNSDPI